MVRNADTKLQSKVSQLAIHQTVARAVLLLQQDSNLMMPVLLLQTTLQAAAPSSKEVWIDCKLY
jgi:hypothetical protein